MAMWIRKIILTVVAVVPVIAGEIVRMADCGEPGATAPVSSRRPSDCPSGELRWRTLEPPSALALPATVAGARGASLRGC